MEGDDHAQYSGGTPPLHWAASNGQVEKLKVLVEEMGTDVNAQDKDGVTPLHMAACAGHVETLRLLVELGGNVLTQTPIGNSALHMASLNGHAEIVRVLMKMGADAHAQDVQGHTPVHRAADAGHVETVKVLVEMGGDVHARAADGITPLIVAAAGGHVKMVRLLLQLGSNVLKQCMDGRTPLHHAATSGDVETVRVLMDMGCSALAQDARGRTPLHWAENNGHEAVVRFLRNDAKIKQRSKSTTAPVVDPAAQAAAEVAATAMAALLIAEEEDHKQSAPSKQGSSNKARKHRPRRKANTDELDNSFKGHNEAISGSVASGSGRRDNGGERDDIGTNAARHNKPDENVGVYGAEGNASPVFNNNNQSRNKPEGDSNGRTVQRVEASRIVRDAGTSHSRIEQPTATQAEHQHQRERERKGKQKLRKRATTQATFKETRATLEEALARVDTAGASLDTLDVLDAAILIAKPVVSSCASGDLSELLRQAEEKSLNVLREVRAMAKAAEKGDTCVVCLAAPKNSLLLPCKHIAMCAECTKAVFTSSSQPQCPVCRSRIADCVYGVFF